MRKATILTFTLALLFAGSALGQPIEHALNLPLSEDFFAPFSVGIHSGARTVAGPYDLDGDGLTEVLVSDYTGGGRVHVVENVGIDTWELVFSTPPLDSTATTNNIRVITGGDLDNDGNGEILFLSGRNFSQFNPDIANRPPGLYVFENVGDNDYGTAPASIYDFPTDPPDRWRAEQMSAVDVDGDGFQEVLFGNNGSNGRYDNWYVLSVTGDIGTGFETWVEELRLSSRAGEDFDPVNRGGGSPYGIVAADLDGDGTKEIAMQSWNNYNFTNVDVTGPDTYVAPGEGAPNAFLRATAADQVAFFGCIAVDINQDGDDEVFCPNLQTGDVSLLNYETGEDPLQVTTDNVVVDLIPTLSGLGIGAGDLDNDGNMELFGTGPSYTAASKTAGNLPTLVRMAEFQGGIGGDPEDPANYEVTDFGAFEPFDTLATNFDLVLVDSAGTRLDEFLENTGFTGKDRAGGIGGQGAIFASKFAYLGDPDGDGNTELAFGIQGVDDSTYTLQATFNPADSTFPREILERQPAPGRVFMRIISGNGLTVDIEDERIVVPSDYVLSANYPNPFNPSTSFTFTLPIDKRVSVKVYDIMGRLVTTLVDNELYVAGTHQATWDGRNNAGMQVASGTYIYTLEHGNFRQSRTMLLVK
ncbi:MAG: FG-GAP-like repeat-containing protein [Rhodothermales bacterium]